MESPIPELESDGESGLLDSDDDCTTSGSESDQVMPEFCLLVLLKAYNKTGLLS